MRSRARSLRSREPACGDRNTAAPDAAGSSPTAGIATLAPAFGQALPSLVDVRTEYSHEVNAELVYELSAALVRAGLGTAETSKQSGGSALQFAQHAMMSGIGAEQGDLLRRNVKFHLEVSDVLGRAGSDAALESGQLAVTIECGGAGYLMVGPAIDALEAEAEGFGAAFYWALTHALYRVMRVSNGELNIRALSENKRPESSAKLAVAPFWNLSDDGRVCTGTMRRPESASGAAVPAWERGFYESAFTHANVGRLTRHKGGFEGLWTGLRGKRKRFPLETLINLPQTLAQFVGGMGI